MIVGRETVKERKSAQEKTRPVDVLDRYDDGGMKSVLVVDDDMSFLASIAEMVSLIDPEYDVMTAENGDQAISILRTLPVGLLLTDIRMPVVTGSELVLWMKENMPRTPVIVMSAGNDADTVSAVEGAGYFFFDKPLDVTRLVRVINSLLQKNKGDSTRTVR